MLVFLQRLNPFQRLLSSRRRLGLATKEGTPLTTDCRALAQELDNVPLSYSRVSVDPQYQSNVWSSGALGKIDDLDDRNFRPMVTDDPRILHSSEPSFDDAYRPVKLFSEHEIHAQVNVRIVVLQTSSINVDDPYIIQALPALFLRYNEIVGSNSVVCNRDASIYYDFCAKDIASVVSSRGVKKIPTNPHEKFFRNHAVSVFVEVHPVKGIKNGPYYRYTGDCYLLKTDGLLSRQGWDAQSAELKASFVDRFVEAFNAPPNDSYRAQNDFTWVTALETINIGNIYPLLILKQAYPQEQLVPSVQINRDNVLPSSVPSVYSQDSATREYTGEGNGMHFFAGPVGNQRNVLSPLPADSTSSRVTIIFPNGSQEIYSPCRESFHYDVDYQSSRLFSGHPGYRNEYEEDDYDGDDENGEDSYSGYPGYQSNVDGDHADIGDDGFDSSPGTDGDEIIMGTPISSGRPVHVELNREECDRLEATCVEMEETADNSNLGRTQMRFIEDTRALIRRNLAYWNSLDESGNVNNMI
ncbi:hypothetical protein H0H93_013634 [Arthromyces matolae]|nr:hypothetical protein H0H93_013634 [Arthromyces matolae]